MALEPKVFKAYDVRGIYPVELDEDGAGAIGRAYVEQFEPATIAVGRDMRLSSPTMQEAFMRGAAEAGADVVDIGMIGTEMLYYAVGSASTAARRSRPRTTRRSTRERRSCAAVRSR